MEDTIKEGEVRKTIELNDNIILDFDNKDKLIGVEILDEQKPDIKEAFNIGNIDPEFPNLWPSEQKLPIFNL